MTNAIDTIARALTYIEFKEKTVHEYQQAHEYETMAETLEQWGECSKAFHEMEKEEYLIHALSNALYNV